MNSLAPLPSMGGFSLPSMGSASGSLARRSAHLSRRQKAAVIVRVLLSKGDKLPIADLPDEMQEGIADEIARMRSIDRETMNEIIEEFANEIEAVGLTFPGSLDGALTLLDGHLSPSTFSRLRRLARSASRGDPWERVVGVDVTKLLPVLQQESIEVGAVLLSKLAVSKAADLLGRLPGERARRIAYGVSLTGNIDPDTVRRIGQSLATQLEGEPARAFDAGPVERVGAILNFSPAGTREEVLKGLEEDDAAFADEVRKAIFTFTNIPMRIDARDIPKITRNVDQMTLVTALAAARGADEKTAEFILANMSQRLAGSLRDEMANLGTVKVKVGEAAKGVVVAQIREMEAAGEIFLVAGEEEDE